jgi:hypothetical protein
MCSKWNEVSNSNTKTLLSQEKVLNGFKRNYKIKGEIN